MKKRIALVALAISLIPSLVEANAGLWVSTSKLSSLSSGSAAYTRMASYASTCTSTTINATDICDQNSTKGVCCLANALKYAKSGDTTARTKAATCLTQVTSAINSTWATSCRALAIGRNMKVFPIVADLLTFSGLTDTTACGGSCSDENTALKTALRTALTKTTYSGSSNLQNCAYQRPQNWGAHCMSSVIAIDTYIDDATAQTHLTTVESKLKGFLGESGGDNSTYSYDTADICTSAGGTTAQCGNGARDDWQANAPVVDTTFPHYGPSTCHSFPSSSTQRCWGINPQGATRKACAGGALDDRACATNTDCNTCATNADCDGTSGGCSAGRCKCTTYGIDGVLADDQRRDDVSGGIYGGFRAPFGVTYTKINYPWEAINGLMPGVAILYNYHAGTPNPFAWGNSAIKRFFAWEYNTDTNNGNNFPPTGNDTFLPWMANYYYGTNYSAPQLSTPSSGNRGGFWFTDWTHAGTGGPAPCPACANAAKDCTETDVDCGNNAGSGCGTCADNKNCAVNADCTGGYCIPGSLICDTCAANGANCSNTVKDCQETDVDCGKVGSGTFGCSSTTCANTKACDNNADCTSGFCNGSLVCANAPATCPNCANTTKDCLETDVDCGGGACAGCAVGKTCNNNTDCGSGTNLRCAAGTCDVTTTTTTMHVTTTTLPASGCVTPVCVE